VKVVILAGGYGSRFNEETHSIPKPMISIGQMPILWHLMKIYSHYGFNDFIICCGYKGEVIKDFFLKYHLRSSDFSIQLHNNEIIVHKKFTEEWNVTLIDTGLNTMTGGRLKRIKEYLKDEENFFMTYGDGLGDVNIRNLLEFHKMHGKDATLTSTLPPGRFGALRIENNQITSFTEKPIGDGTRVNGGFFVLKPSVLDLINNDSTIWEREPLESLSGNNQLMAYAHDGFWQPMDTLKDKNTLNDLWVNGNRPWAVWE